MEEKSRKVIGWWLLSGVIIIFIQVILGGITRLTGSGLSITEWNVIMGTIPPLNQTEWQYAFDQYKQFPQYRLMNSDMTLHGFKSIFWWEYIHRLWARFLIPVFLIPLFYFIIKKLISKELLIKAFIAFVLGALQGVVGWIMVKSGLMDKPWVSPINLSTHLILALVLYCYLFWVALEVLQPASEQGAILTMKRSSFLLTALLFLQIFYGGLMAGHKAALFYPTFPKIGAGYIPHGIFSLTPWPANLVESVGMIQIIHRTLGFIIALFIIYFFVRSQNKVTTPLLRVAMISLPVLAVIQVLLGILTLLNSLGRISLPYALLHQVTALLMLTVSVITNFQLSEKSLSNAHTEELIKADLNAAE